MEKIIKTEWGIAHRIGNNIYLNKELDKYPNLKEAILTHENNHSDSLKFKDILMDCTGKNLENVKNEYYKFILQNPKSLVVFLPFYYIKGKIQIDVTMILFWIFVLVIILSIVYSR